MDFLVLWGVTQAVGFVFKPILEELVKDAAKDYVKDFFKSCLSNVLRFPKQEPLQIATGKAITEFLKLIQQELEDADLDNTTILQYCYFLEEFIKNKQVAEILGSAFITDSIDTKSLKQIWKQLQSKTLPDEFNWERVTKRYLKKVKAIIQETPELRAILDSQNLQKLADTVPVQPDFDLIKHQEGIREWHGNLNLESLDTTGCAYNELKLWQIFVPQNVRECQEYLPQVYEMPKDYLKQLKERGELDEDVSLEDLEQRHSLYSQQQIQSILEIINNPSLNYLVVLGDPGSGKSTLLRYLALQWAELSPQELPNYRIPLLIQLRTYAREKREKQRQGILEFFHQGNVICRLPQQELHSRLQQGDVLVMFDGLDEVFDPAQRHEVITDIHRFTNDYPKIRAIVTSRVIGYKAQRFKNAEFRHFMLQDLEDEQIDDFIQRWHDSTFTDEADKIRKRDRLKQAISNSSAIKELAGNPLLLTMMAILNRNQELPRDRAELYNQASRVLLHQWDIERTLRDERIDPVTIDYKDKQEMLRRVAFFMQGNEQGLAGNLINRDDLERILTEYLRDIVSDARTIARALIEQLRTRNFILCYVGSDFYAFVHRSFLEYFCAWEFVWQFEKERSLSEEELVQVYAEHWREEAWHEVLRLMAGMLDPKFIGKVLEYLIQQKINRRAFIDPVAVAVVNRNILTKNGIMHLLLASDLLRELHHDQNIEGIRGQLLELIETEIKKTEKEIPLNFDAAKAAFESMILTSAHEKWQILPQLKKYIQPNNAWEVRQATVWAIATYYRDDPQTFSWLLKCIKDGNSAARKSAIKAISTYFKDDPQTLPLLKKCAQTDQNWRVRRAAVEELACCGYTDDPETLAILKIRAQTDADWSVRGAAVQELAKGYKDNLELFELFCDRTVNDPFERQKEWQENPRQTALEAILKNYSDHPQTLPLLRDHAENDADEQLREWAQQQLEKFENRGV
jgi:predicted NACHT family NTPase